MASSVEFTVKKHGKVSADPDSLTVVAGAQITFSNDSKDNIQITFPNGVLSGSAQFTVNPNSSSIQTILSSFTGTASYSFSTIKDGYAER